MPLNKTITANTGNDGSYWVLSHINMRLDRDGNYFEALLLQYKSTTDYDNGVEAMGQRKVRWSDAENPVTLANAAALVTAVYQKIIDDPGYDEFDDATIVP